MRPFVSPAVEQRAAWLTNGRMVAPASACPSATIGRRVDAAARSRSAAHPRKMRGSPQPEVCGTRPKAWMHPTTEARLRPTTEARLRPTREPPGVPDPRGGFRPLGLDQLADTAGEQPIAMSR